MNGNLKLMTQSKVKAELKNRGWIAKYEVHNVENPSRVSEEDVQNDQEMLIKMLQIWGDEKTIIFND